MSLIAMPMKERGRGQSEERRRWSKKSWNRRIRRKGVGGGF